VQRQRGDPQQSKKYTIRTPRNVPRAGRKRITLGAAVGAQAVERVGFDHGPEELGDRKCCDRIQTQQGHECADEA